MVSTSREPLPAPFDAAERRLDLSRLGQEDAVRLVERVLGPLAFSRPAADLDARRDEIEALVEAVHGHARTLALLAPSLRAQGVARTQAELTDLMVQMERDFPGSRERSVFASLELSLRRLSPANRERVLGVFHGAVDLAMLGAMMQRDELEVRALAKPWSTPASRPRTPSAI